jgi:alkylation response protein AidB-like acyl-CoA dehydrogenase
VISFGLTEEQEVVREAMRDFAAEAVRPLAHQADESSSLPDGFLDQAWELGLTSTQLPESFGGGGEERSPVTNVLVLEELAHADAALTLAAVAPSLFANAVADHGTDGQKAELLPLFCGEKFHAASLALVEPGALFDANTLKTVAEPKGQGFVLSGRKSFVPFATTASHFLVIARNNGGRDAFIVPRDAEGLTISETEKNLGLRALPTATLDLERVEVPASARLGGDAGCDVQRIIDGSRVALSAVMLGLSRAVLEYCVPYAKDREAFDEPISKKQAIAFMLSDMHIEVESMRWMVWKAASLLERGEPATRAAHLARTYCADKSMWVADNGIQVLGGHGFIREHPVELWFRHARTLGVLEGTASA